MNEVYDTHKVKPKVLPFRCPNCGGRGTVGYALKKCHSCEGKGYILVEQEIKEDQNG